MKLIKTYTAIRIKDLKEETSSFSYNLVPKLSFGNSSEISGGIIKSDFATEQEAIEYAYEQDKYSDWLILPKISFDNF